MTVIPVWFQMDILQTLSTSLPLKNLYWAFLKINRFSNVPFQTALLDRGKQHQFFSATISSILLSIQQACGEKYETKYGLPNKWQSHCLAGKHHSEHSHVFAS